MTLPPQIAGKPSSISRLGNTPQWPRARYPGCPAARRGTTPAASLDPQADRIPGAAEDAGLLDRLQHHQRHLGTGGRRPADLERADALALGERRDQRVGALDLGLALAALPSGTVTKTRRPAELDGLLASPFQTGGVDDGLVGVEQLDAPRTPGSPSSAASGSRWRGRSRWWRPARSPAGRAPPGQVREVALGGGDQAVAGRLGVAGLHAVDGRVAAQQQVAVVSLAVGVPCSGTS